MKNSYQQISVLVIGALFLFSSCSRELTSIPHMNKLANAQTLEKQKTPVQKTEPMALIQVATPALLPPVTNSSVAPSTSGQPIKMVQARNLIHHSITNILPKQAGKEILKQANNIRHIGTPNQIASHSKATDGGSWIGLAITCLIVAVVLFAFGFGLAAAILWEIGIIILVIALVFFILWLLARAVTG